MDAEYWTDELRRTDRSADSNNSNVAFSSDPFGRTSLNIPSTLTETGADRAALSGAF